MKLASALSVLLLPAALTFAQSPAPANAPAAPAQTPTTQPADGFASLKERASYAIGMEMGNSLKQDMVDIDPDLLAQGMKDALAGKSSRLTPDQTKQAMMDLQKEVMAKQEAREKAAAEKNKTEGKAYLEKHAKQEGVKTTASGLQYKVIKEGDGKSPSAEDKVVVHYAGTLIDGTEFDSSYKRGQPATFDVGRIIPGWKEALQLMKPGGKYHLVIPAELAYGEFGAGDKIGPNAVLVFDVELIAVQPAPAPTPGTGPGNAPAIPGMPMPKGGADAPANPK